jgi:hypothetical protein
MIHNYVVSLYRKGKETAELKLLEDFQKKELQFQEEHYLTSVH